MTPAKRTGDEHAEAVRGRVRKARADLAAAAASRNASAVRDAVDEMEEALALARIERVEVPAGEDGRTANGSGAAACEEERR
ncbi:hypothetical protein [Yinghuangia sp. YIM S10712]|uniref:hypothetical protein n=1 Tax=Yinghuangia sp. YIM S10712 TaxID=3436930 RepID=UPI003F529986